MAQKKALTVILALLAVFIFSPLALADKYTIQDPSTHGLIVDELTTAVIETTEDYIRLPRGNPNSISFLGEDSFDVIVLTKNGIEKISPDGSGKGEPIISMNELSNPTAVFAGGMFPDVITVEDDGDNSKVTHYSHIGSNEYTNNSDLTLSGLDKTINVVTKELDKATLTAGGQFIYHHWLGEEKYQSMPISSGYSNPISAALLADTYDALVLDNNGVHHISNLSTNSNIIAGTFTSLSAIEGGNFAIIGEDSAVHYNLVGSNAYENEYLTIKSGLDAPSAVALRPGSFDRAIVDGDLIKFFLWTGDSLELAGEVEFDVLDGIGKYIGKARVVSNIFSVKDKSSNKLDITHVRINSGEINSIDIPNSTDTWVEFWVSTDTDVMKNSDEVNRGDFSSTLKWQRINTQNEWYSLDEPAKDVRWMAVLRTKNGEITPIIREYINIDLRVDIQPPELNLPTGPYYTSNPEIWWTFDDTVADREQSAFQLVVYKNEGGADKEVLNTGKVLSKQGSYTIRNTNAHPSLWNEGTNQFKVKVKVWDDTGSESKFTDAKGFSVMAFDRPVITEIISPPMKGREWIKRFTPSMELPVSKAGTAVTFRIHGIGADLDKADIYYPGSRTLDKNNSWNIKTDLEPVDVRDRDRVIYLEEFKEVDAVGSNKVWEATFYTEADTDKCPNGTVIVGQFYYNVFSGSESLLTLDGFYDYKNRLKPSYANWTLWEGYRWWAEGISIVNDTVLSDWIVVLKAKD